MPAIAKSLAQHSETVTPQRVAQFSGSESAGFAAGESLYLDRKAKSDRTYSAAGMFTCGDGPVWAAVGSCPNGDLVAKKIVCGREWCRKCGQMESDAHNRRIARLTKKYLQFETVAYGVFTIPPAQRDRYRTRLELANLGRRFTRLMKYHGFDRGIRSFDYFGETKEGVTPEYHPHINVLLDVGFIQPETLAGLKYGWRRLLGIKCTCGRSGLACKCVDMWFSFTDAPAQKWHKLKYITRATFKDAAWDEVLALELIGMHRVASWGKWDGPAVWEPPNGEGPTDHLLKIVTGCCPDDELPITWQSKVVSGAIVESAAWRDLGAGYYFAKQDHVPESRPVEPKPRIKPTGDPDWWLKWNRSARRVRFDGFDNE